MARLLHLVFESRNDGGRDDLRRFLAFLRGSVDRALHELEQGDRERDREGSSDPQPPKERSR